MESKPDLKTKIKPDIPDQATLKTVTFSYENAIELDFKSENARIYKRNVNENLRKAFNYLNYLKEPSLLVDDQQAYEAIFYIAKKVTRSLKYIDLNLIFDQSNESELFSNILTYLYNINSKYDFSLSSIAQENANKKTTFNERCITIFGCMNYILYLVINQTLKFARQFQMTNGLKAFIMFLKDYGFVNKNLNSSFNPIGAGEMAIIDEMTLNLCALSNNCEENKSIWSDLDVVNILLKISKIKPKTSLDCYLTIANISNDYQMENLDDLNVVVEMMISYFKKCADDFHSNKIHRKAIKIFENNTFRMVKVHCFNDKYSINRSLYSILNGLYKFSINEKIKNIIYFNELFNKNFAKIFVKSNQPELFYLLNLIAQFTFSESICVSLRQDNQIISLLNETKIKPKNFKIKRICEQINWNLFEKNLRILSVKSKETNNLKHVMISFYLNDNVTKELCIKLKKNLESSGNQVWMNLTNITDHSKIVEAIEESYCYLMCVNEKYRQSVTCQIEAKYAFEIKKPIISLILQNEYESLSHGWLSVILSSSHCINFSKYNFQQCSKLLDEKVSLAHANNLSNETINTNPASLVTEKNFTHKLPENLSETEVDAWFKRHDIDSLIVNYLKLCKCDGLILQQIYFMKMNDPQFYNFSFKKIPDLNFISLVKFSAELDKLFNKNLF